VGLAEFRSDLSGIRRRARRALLVAWIAGGMGSEAAAQTPSSDVARGARDAPVAETLEPVVVSATRIVPRGLDRPAAPASVDAALIREAGPQLHLSEALSRIPGLAAFDRQNQAQDLQVSIRGFGARASFGVRGVRLIVDGIPLTMPDGQGQASSIGLAAVERIEVLRGPLAMLHGNAAGGVLQVFTADAPQRPQARLDAGAGSFGAWRAGLLAGGGSAQARLSVDASRFASEGFRDHSAARREQFGGKLQLALAGDRDLMLVAHAFEQPLAQDPLGLTREQMLADPRQAGAQAIAFDTRKRVSQQQMGGVLSQRLDADTRLGLRVYGGQRAVFQTLAIPLGAQMAATSSGGVIDLDRAYGGLGVQLSRSLHWGEMPVAIVVGVDHDRQDERRLGFVNQAGVPGALKRDELNRVSNSDVYGLLTLRPAAGWRLDAGARASTVRFVSDDRYVVPGNGDDSGSARYRAVSPVIGVSRAFAGGWWLYGSLGRGFETPTFAELAYRSTTGSATGLNLGLLASRSTQTEVGVKWLSAAGQRIDASIFAIRTRDEIVVDANSGGRSTFRNAGRTLREGAEIAWIGRLTDTLGARVALSWLSAGFRDGHPAAVAGAGSAMAVAPGNRLPGAPDRLAFAELVWRTPAVTSRLAGESPSVLPAGLHAAFELRHRGRMMVDDANTDAAEAATLAGVRVGWAHELDGWRLQALARIDNLADRRTVGSVIVNEANRRYFEPAPGRQVWVGLSVGRTF
jgi:iron complex outermembrane receptor protein